ncbi:hypothetical protein BDZ97DRAFT_1938213 [Flammula alnicola]|nr:hypothetical protein BDZ97DRAFT_1938213 [Flammula alnicola]
MASHPAYPNPGPGPSSYYQQSPPPHHVYGAHNPGPRQPYYPYPGPPPPHMNSHQPAQYHQQGPSRGNHRGGNVGGSYGSRGTHNYHNYQQPHQQPIYAHSHVSPLGVHPPHPQHGSQHIYSPQSAKYNQPFATSYPYPSPTAPVFTPSWQTQQPISPLPKQLSMPPPQNIHQPFHEPPPAPSPAVQRTPTPPSPVLSPVEAVETLEIPLEIENIELPPPSPSTPPPAVSSSPEPTSLPQTSSYSQMGTISTSDSVSPPSPSSSSPSRKAVANPIVKWAIWSRRPQDPSHAPSIIISPRARPPPDVVQQALDLKTPPPSPPAVSPTLSTKPLPLAEEEPTPADEASSPVKEFSPLPALQSSDEAAVAAWVSQTNSSVPSSSVTESTDTPAVPGSPASSLTSLSVFGTPVKDAKEITIRTAEAGAVATATAETSTTSTILASAESASVPAPAVGPAEEEQTKEPSAPTTSSAATPTSETLANPVVVSPQPAPAVPPPSAPKKSWASLLRPASSSSSASPGPSRNALPTSSVVGFSIPAAAPSSNPAMPVSPSKKSELVTLLTTGPAVAAAGASLKIRPRGLVNSGNMCFANSVLQVLVYCPPFHRLFVDLGRVLVGPVVGNGNATAVVNGKDEAGRAAGSATPLVDATVEFLREFAEDKKSKAKEKAKLEVVVNRNGVNGGGSGRGKGKEREIKDDVEEEDDWDGDSFMPTYVYDAMKAKKRFDNMRGGHQEDAEEFFGFYLDTLEEELLSILHTVNPPKQSKAASSAAAGASSVEEKEEAAPPEDDGWLEVGKRNRMVVTRTIKATESPITRIFGGKFRSTLRAPHQKDSVIVEDWRSLRLDIQREQIHTIEEALSYISHPQPVQVTQPTRPGITVDAQQQVLIEALPPILVLHIKRFCYDTAVGGVVKVGKQVRFGPELEIGSDVMVPAAKKAQPTRYKLFGALYHHGLSASGGHYTLDVLHPNRYPNVNPSSKPREGWVRIDDDLVSDVRHEDVFGAYERDDSRCAYLLFYRRI